MIYETAGILGIDPGPFTLRELIWMLDGYRVETWHHTAAQMSLVANINRGKNARGYSPLDFHPFVTRQQRKRVDEKAPIEALKVFVDGRVH